MQPKVQTQVDLILKSTYIGCDGATAAAAAEHAGSVSSWFQQPVQTQPAETEGVMELI